MLRRLTLPFVAVTALSSLACSEAPSASGGDASRPDSAIAGAEGGGIDVESGTHTDAASADRDAPLTDASDERPSDSSVESALESGSSVETESSVESDGSVDVSVPVDGGNHFGNPCSCVNGTCLMSGCLCDPGWGGEFCDGSVTLLAAATPVTGTVGQRQWLFYSFYGLATGVTATLTEQTTVGDVWLYLNAGTEPTPAPQYHLAADENTASSMHQVTYSFAGPGMQTWYVGVYGQPELETVASFTLELTVIP